MLATIILHNYLRTNILSNDIIKDEDDKLYNNFNESNFSSLAPNRNRSSIEEFSIRKNLTECFNSNYGSVVWQSRVVQRGQF